MARATLLLTRPADASQELLDRLDPGLLRQVQVILSPLIDIVAIADPPDMTGHAGAIFTSAQGVGFAVAGAGKPAWCVGARTAQAAQARGWLVQHVAPDADALVAALNRAPPAGPLVHLAGRHRRGEIAARVAAAGVRVDVHTLYDQCLLPLTDAAREALSGTRPVVLPLYSPRTAAHLATQVRDCPATHALAMSDAVARAARQVLFATQVTLPEPTAVAMTRGIEMLLRRNSLP